MCINTETLFLKVLVKNIRDTLIMGTQIWRSPHEEALTFYSGHLRRWVSIKYQKIEKRALEK